MIESLTSIYPYYIFLSIFVIIISILLFLNTKTYKKSKSNFYAIFLNLNIRGIVLLSSCILNLSFILFFSFYIKSYNILSMWLIIINTFLSICICLNIHMILFDIVYSIITLVCLKLYSLVYIYINEIYYDKNVLLLMIVFGIMLGVYGLFITVRKSELILKVSRKKVKNAE